MTQRSTPRVPLLLAVAFAVLLPAAVPSKACAEPIARAGAISSDADEVQGVLRCPVTDTDTTGGSAAYTYDATRRELTSGSHVGDRVKATDPATGRSTDRTVTAVMVHRDDDLLDVTVHDPDGSDGVIHATAHHPFWDDTAHAWVDAANLHQGERLHTPDGSVVTVAALIPVPGTADMWDLTVDSDHTYYVVASGPGSTTGPAVLVHNAGPCRLGPDPEASGPHTTFKRDPVTGEITGYAEYQPQTNPMNPNPWELVKRVDVTGKPHFNKVSGDYVPTPHVQGPGIPGGVRPADPGEIP